MGTDSVCNGRQNEHQRAADRCENNSTAANSTIGTFNRCFVQFLDNSTAGSASISVIDSSELDFADTSTAASASIFADGGFISFNDSSRGGTAQISLKEAFFSGSVLDISGHNAPGVTIGSLEGDETAEVFLGANNLTVGSNNLSTTFSGVIQDSGVFGGNGGSLTKIGTGTLIFSGGFSLHCKPNAGRSSAAGKNRRQHLTLESANLLQRDRFLRLF